MRCSILKWAIWFVAPACVATVWTANPAQAQQKSIAPAAAAQPATGDAAAKPPSAPIVIADEPKAIDPVTLVPEKLAAKANVQFKDSSLTDVVKWIREHQKIGVTLDTKALAAANILLSEPVTDQLNNEPLYLLLDRLRALELGWYMEGGILYISTSEAAAAHLSTVPYNLGDLIDAGYEANRLLGTVVEASNGASREGNAGGGVVLLGDVLFVRHTSAMQREVVGLLAALRRHGRQTLTTDAPQHAILRQKLEQNVTVNFKDAPLADAVADIARKAQADIRLDRTALRKAGVRERIPVSLELADQELKVVLGALLAERNLTWILRDGVLWITPQDQAKKITKTAVYDVRDLCRDDSESAALHSAIITQASGPWSNGTPGQEGGTISSARPGVMVIRQTESQLAEVLALLENYRMALRASKPRKRTDVDPKEVITRYYRLQTPVAEDLVKFLPQLVRSETWKNAEKPNAVGTIVKVTSTTDLRDAQGVEALSDETRSGPALHALVVRNSVLIVRQMREVHESIAELMRKIESGDAPEGSEGGSGAGGFGGGFFSLPPTKR